METLYHGTNAKFDAFNLDFAARPDMASNGFLGVWLAADREHASRFGQFCLTVHADIKRPHVIPIDTLVAWHRESSAAESEEASDDAIREFNRKYYTDLRNKLLAEGFDTIKVRENSGLVDIVIGLIPERLHIQ